MIANIVCGSPNTWIDFEALSLSNDLLIGVDRGTLFLLNLGLIPDIAIGDFDSISSREYEQVLTQCQNVMKLDREKNETDTEVAINYAISQRITEIHIYGGLGGRFDHTIANTRLLLQFAKQNILIKLIDQTNSITVLGAGTHFLRGLPHRYLSFFAVESTVTELTLEGVKYPLNRYLLTQDDVRCISNELVEDSAKVIFESGYLLMINSDD